MKKKWIVLSLLLFLFIGVSCSKTNKESETSNQTKTSQAEEFEVPITLIDNEKEVAKKTVTATEKESVMKLCQKVFEVKEDNGFVTSIDGIEQDAKNNRYWLFYINGKEAAKGANDITVKKGDSIEWRLNEYQ